jgi:HEAT repeat protein
MGPSLSASIGIAILLAVIAAGFAIARGVHRRSRFDARARTRDLERLFAEHLRGGSSARRLLHAADAAETGVFWSALETFSFRLERKGWLTLSTALERHRHARPERRALRDDSPWRRELAVRRLSLLTSVASRRALRAALARGPEPVAYAAAMGLARAHDARALRWILSHPEALGSRSAPRLVSLFRAFGRGALPIVLDALERGSVIEGEPREVDLASARSLLPPSLEIAIVETLGLGRRSAAAAAIARRLDRDDLDARAAAARALGRIGSEDCASSLLAALDDPAWQVRAQAALALGRARITEATLALAARLTDRSWWVRRHAAYALMEMGEGGRTALTFAAERSPDPYARDIAREALDGGIDPGAASSRRAPPA